MIQSRCLSITGATWPESPVEEKEDKQKDEEVRKVGPWFIGMSQGSNGSPGAAHYFSALRPSQVALKQSMKLFTAAAIC